MGKYIRKSKIDGGGGGGESSIALMDVVSPSSSSSSSLGVLTRAKSLALQQQQQQQRRLLQKPSSSSLPPTSPSPNPPSKQKNKKKQQMNDCGSYLQLRSRRLQKKPPIVVIRSTKRRKETCGRNPNPSSNLDSIRGSICADGSRSDSVSETLVFGKDKELVCEINKDPSFGQNFFDLEEEEPTQRYHFYYPYSPIFNLFFFGDFIFVGFLEKMLVLDLNFAVDILKKDQFFWYFVKIETGVFDF